jgi:succinate dehydrogenase / fumarate reductase cytochrome b subunit
MSASPSKTAARGIPFYPAFLRTSVGQKLLTALTGVALVGFIVLHLLGNLTLLAPDSEPFNLYAHSLDKLGPLKYAAEIGLIVLFGLHIVNGILLKLDHKRARPTGYGHAPKSKGGPSYSNASSRNMIVSGSILLFFLILHIIQFRFGPSINEGYTAILESGTEVRDLHRLVVETFSSPAMVAIYVGVMIFLGSHLRHGFWSMFQSLGLMKQSRSNAIYTAGLLIGFALAVGFLVLPLILYFRAQGA